MVRARNPRQARGSTADATFISPRTNRFRARSHPSIHLPIKTKKKKEIAFNFAREFETLSRRVRGKIYRQTTMADSPSVELRNYDRYSTGDEERTASNTTIPVESVIRYDAGARGGRERKLPPRARAHALISEANHPELLRRADESFSAVGTRDRRQFQYISRDYKHTRKDSSILHYLTVPTTPPRSLEQAIRGLIDRCRIIHITRSEGAGGKRGGG